MAVHFHEEDLPAGVLADGPVAVDTETMGLVTIRDRLCVGVMATPCYCTKIASKLIRTYTDRHGLKMLVEELLGENISKAQQSSDWGGPVLNDAQREYAASDVRYLHRMKEELDRRLEREGRTEMAQACFDFLPTRARLDVAGWADHDIFSHM